MAVSTTLLTGDVLVPYIAYSKYRILHIVYGAVCTHMCTVYGTVYYVLSKVPYIVYCMWYRILRTHVREFLWCTRPVVEKACWLAPRIPSAPGLLPASPLPLACSPRPFCPSPGMLPASPLPLTLHAPRVPWIPRPPDKGCSRL